MNKITATPDFIRGGYYTIEQAVKLGIINVGQADMIDREILKPAEKRLEEVYDEYNAEDK